MLLGSIPGWGIKIPQALWCGRNKTKKARQWCWKAWRFSRKPSTSFYGCLPRSLFLSCVTTWVVCLVLSLSFRPWLESPRLIRPLVPESLPDSSGDLPSWLAVGLDAPLASSSSISDNHIWKSLSATCPGYCHDFTLLWNHVISLMTLMLVEWGFKRLTKLAHLRVFVHMYKWFLSMRLSRPEELLPHRYGATVVRVGPLCRPLLLWIEHLRSQIVFRCSVAKLCPILCDPMDCSTPGSSFLHCLLVFGQIHAHWVADAILLSHTLLPPPPPALNISASGSFPVCSSHQVAKYWSFSISPSNAYSGFISFEIDWFDLLAAQGTLKSLL